MACPTPSARRPEIRAPLSVRSGCRLSSLLLDEATDVDPVDGQVADMSGDVDVDEPGVGDLDVREVDAAGSGRRRSPASAKCALR